MPRPTRARSLAILLSTALATSVTGCATPSPANEEAAAEPWPSRPELRAELLELQERDQAARNALIEVMKRSEPRPGGTFELDAEGMQAMLAVQAIDDESSAFLAATIDEVGWPTAELVGRDGAHAAWLLVQHADREPELQRRALELMRAQLGTGQVEPSDVALLTDRVRTAKREPQLYGTQFAAGDDGVQRPLPIEDPEHVDERRAEVGLPPLAEYAKQLGEVYGAPASPEPMAAYP